MHHVTDTLTLLRFQNTLSLALFNRVQFCLLICYPSYRRAPIANPSLALSHFDAKYVLRAQCLKLMGGPILLRSVPFRPYMGTTSNGEPLIINGSVLEGGGQILRNAISLAALLGKPIQIKNIRHGRTPPGLKNQHRTGLDLATRIASGQLTGASNGSTEVEFVPGKIELPGRWIADAVTAGATTLLMQIAFPLLLFRSSSSEPNGHSVLTLLGGTNAGQAPQVDYTQHIFLPFFRKHFLPQDSDGVVELEIKKRGYYPKGGGDIDVRVKPLLPGQKLRCLTLVERGRLVSIRGLAHYAKLPRVVGDGMREGAMSCIREKMEAGTFGIDETTGELVNIEVKREPNGLTRGAGSGIVVWAEFENGVIMGGSAVGKKGVEPGDVGRSAVEEMFKGIETGGCVDEWMQDQMIIFMALAEGKSTVRCGRDGLSLHTRTAIWVAKQLTEAKFHIEQEESGEWMIECEGIGYTMEKKSN